MLQFFRWRVNVTVGGILVKTIDEVASTEESAIGKAKYQMRGAVSNVGAFVFQAEKVGVAQIQREIDAIAAAASKR